MSAASKESALSRWSRRKQEAAEAPPIIEQTPPEASDAEHTALMMDEVPQEEIPLTDADMPDIESLEEDSDFTGFMSPGVSDELRNLALRKLFHAPVFNIRDGLDEYDEDYTSFEKLGDIVTCDMKHQIEVQERKRLEALEQEALEQEALEQEERAKAEAEHDDLSEDVEDIDDDNEAEIETLNEMKPPRQTLAQESDDKPVKLDTADE